MTNDKGDRMERAGMCDLRFSIDDFSVVLVLFCGYLKKQSQLKAIISLNVEWKYV
jgi:hypothetical protein